jgi:hypothetical protein
MWWNTVLKQPGSTSSYISIDDDNPEVTIDLNEELDEQLI